MKNIIGIDIGGTKISVCLGTENGKIITNDRMQTKPFKGSQKAIAAIIDLIRRLLKEEKMSLEEIEAVGISCPGPISHSKGLMLGPPNLKGWENTPIVSLIKEQLKKPTFMNNDANAAALAEFEFGAFKKTSNLLYLTASTGMGGGIITDGKLLQGISDTAGEVGHFVLDIHGPKCPCGQNGCFEVYCGGGNLSERIKREIQENKLQTLILDEAGGELAQIDMLALANAVKKKDTYALKIWDEFVQRLAQGLGILMMSLNPEVIILGTIAIYTKDILFPMLKEKLPHFVWPIVIDKCKIEVSQIADKISELSGLAVAIYALTEE